MQRISNSFNIVLLMILFNSCSSPSSENQVIQNLAEDLQNSNEKLRNSSSMIASSFKDKLTEFPIQEKAIFFWPKFKLIRDSSKKFLNYLYQIKTDLQAATGFENVDNNVQYRNNNFSTVKKFFKEEGRDRKLFERLVKYRETVLHADSRIFHEFQSSLPLLAIIPNDISFQDFEKRFLNHSVTSSLAMLTRIEHSVLLSENEILILLHSTANRIRYFDCQVPSAFIGQSHNVVQGGEKMEITAGIAEFMSAARLVITIEGKKIKLVNNAFAVHSFNAPGQPGKYILPITFEYYDQDGKKNFLKREIEYRVAKE